MHEGQNFECFHAAVNSGELLKELQISGTVQSQVSAMLIANPDESVTV